MSTRLYHHPSRRFNKGIAEIYDQARPSYPKHMAKELLRLPPKAGRILDVGCGTGISTRLFQEGVFHIVGIDSSLQMLRIAQEKEDKNTSFVCSVAERLPFRSGSFSLITVAQAFHWFGNASTLGEFRRLLSEGGTIALFWNTRKAESELNSSFEELCHRYFPEFPLVSKREKECVFTGLWEENGFQEAGFHTFPNEQLLDYSTFLLRCMSISIIHHGLNDTSRPVFKDELRWLFDRLEHDGRVTIKYDCKLYIFQRSVSAVK